MNDPEVADIPVAPNNNTKKKKKKRGKDVVPFSAKLVASIRADESAVLPPEKRLFVDPLAGLLAGNATTMHTNFLYRRVHSDIKDKGMDRESSLASVEAEKKRILDNRAKRPEIVIRTRAIDDAVEDFVFREGKTNEFVQVVLLGAGLDARAYRLRCMQEVQCDVYEVDHPETLRYKEEKLNTCDALARRVVRIGCDLTERTTGEQEEEAVWAQALQVEGFNSAMPTCWVLEGVLMYLTQQQVKQLLASCGALSCLGSEFVADVKNSDAHLVRHFMQKNRRKATNEPAVVLPEEFTQMWNHWVYFQWFIGKEEIPRFFARNGGWHVNVETGGDNKQQQQQQQQQASDPHVPCTASVRTLGGRANVHYNRYLTDPVTVTIPDILVNKSNDKVDRSKPLPLRTCMLNSFLVRASFDEVLFRQTQEKKKGKKRKRTK